MAGEEKLFYSIGEAAQIVEVKPYVLRYWESEFRRLNPQKSETGQRTYRAKDLQIALAIKKLLYEEKYTIAGAVKKLEDLEKAGLPPLDAEKLGSLPPGEEAAETSDFQETGTEKPRETAPRPLDKQACDEFIKKLVECRNLLARHGL